MASTGSSCLQPTSCSLGRRHVQRWTPVAGLHLQQGIRLQEQHLQRWLLPTSSATGPLHRQPNLRRLGREDMGLVGSLSTRDAHMGHLRRRRNGQQLLEPVPHPMDLQRRHLPHGGCLHVQPHGRFPTMGFTHQRHPQRHRSLLPSAIRRRHHHGGSRLRAHRHLQQRPAVL